jgi:glycosyltransferase involved in cell wall biosynthesis
MIHFWTHDMNANSPSIAFVTTCKARLHHIKITLPLIIQQSPTEIVVVDYACPDGVGDWVEELYPQVKVVRVNNEEGFCLAHARNLGAAQTTADWICFIDADIRIQGDWVQWMQQNLDQRFFYRAARKEGVRITDTWGTCICHRSGFERIGGYDEMYRSWGSEDDDIYRRLFLAGVAESSYPAGFVEPIRHTDTERTRFYNQKEMMFHHCVNRFYLEAKYQIMMARNDKSQPPYEVRLQIMERIKQALANWQPGISSPPSISFSSRGLGWLPAPYRMKKEIKLEVAH